MSDVKVVDLGGTIAAHRGLFRLLAAALVVAGILAMAFPFVGGLAVEVWTAIAFIIAGAAQTFHAFAARQWQGFLIGLLVGLLYLAAGVILWLNPIRGLVTLTALLAAIIAVDGVLRTVLAFQIRDLGGWVWMLLSGILGIVVGIMLWQHLPSSAVWALGLMLGLNLIFSGVAFWALTSAAQPMPGTGSAST